MIAYKGICINHKSNTIRVIDESYNKEEVEMNLYLDKQNETAPDKDLCFTWLMLTTYDFNTNLEVKNENK